MLYNANSPCSPCSFPWIHTKAIPNYLIGLNNIVLVRYEASKFLIWCYIADLMEEGYNGSILFGRWYLLARSPFPFINVDPTDKAFAIIQITNPEKTLWYSYDDSWHTSPGWVHQRWVKKLFTCEKIQISWNWLLRIFKSLHFKTHGSQK